MFPTDQSLDGHVIPVWSCAPGVILAGPCSQGQDNIIFNEQGSSSMHTTTILAHANKIIVEYMAHELCCLLLSKIRMVCSFMAPILSFIQ